MTKLGNKITKIKTPDELAFSVYVQFVDGHVGRVSLRHIFEKPKGLAAEILKGGMFDKCFVESGALAWPNGFELCPDSIKQWLTEQQHSPKTKAA